LEQIKNLNLASLFGDMNSGPSFMLSSDTSGRVTVGPSPLKSYSAPRNSTIQLGR